LLSIFGASSILAFVTLEAVEVTAPISQALAFRTGR
jgi:hypothetical protein